MFLTSKKSERIVFTLISSFFFILLIFMSPPLLTLREDPLVFFSMVLYHIVPFMFFTYIFKKSNIKNSKNYNIIFQIFSVLFLFYSGIYIFMMVAFLGDHYFILLPLAWYLITIFMTVFNIFIQKRSSLPEN